MNGNFSLQCSIWMDLIKHAYEAFTLTMRNVQCGCRGGKKGRKSFIYHHPPCWPWPCCKAISGSENEEIKAIKQQSLGNQANKKNVNGQTYWSLDVAHVHRLSHTDTHTHTVPLKVHRFQRTYRNMHKTDNDIFHVGFKGRILELNWNVQTRRNTATWTDGFMYWGLQRAVTVDIWPL